MTDKVYIVEVTFPGDRYNTPIAYFSTQEKAKAYVASPGEDAVWNVPVWIREEIVQ